MSYDSITVLVVKDGIEIPPIKALQETDETTAGPGYIYFKWNWKDWWVIGREVDNWLSTLDDDDYYFLRDGEEDDDYEVRGRFTDPDIHIGIIIPNRTGSLLKQHQEEPNGFYDLTDRMGLAFALGLFTQYVLERTLEFLK